MLSCAIEATGLLDRHPTGITRYTRSLIEALSALEVPASDAFELTQLWRSSRWKRRDRLPRGPRLSAQMWRSGLWPLSRPWQVVHCPANRMPPWRGPAYVSTIHDLYAALGINHADPGSRERQLAVYREQGARSTRLICVSEHTRQDWLRLIGGDASRIHVVHLGVADRFRPHSNDELSALRQRLELPQPYLLFVGHANPNKNLPRLLEAYARSTVRAHCQLALVGGAPPDEQRTLVERISALGLGKRIRMLGYVNDADLPALYAGAAAYLFPSLYEGFGLPILEAMASGVPVLTSTAASCPEVAAGHAVLVNPESVDAIAEGLDQVVAMNAAQREAARAYAATKTWQRTADATLAIYRLAAQDHRGGGA